MGIFSSRCKDCDAKDREIRTKDYEIGNLKLEVDHARNRNSELHNINKELQAVVDGNGEWYGIFQQRFSETRQALDNANLHIKLEKELYQKLYEQNRGLEIENYLLERELDLIRKEILE